MTEQLSKCVYCSSQDNPFNNREHVVPQAFGNYEPTSFILCGAVCDPCNQYFGDTLDLKLSRDSIEAIRRLQYGVKPASAANNLMYGRTELKINQPGPWFGATAVIRPDCSGVGIEPVPVPQVAFRRIDTTEWEYFSEKQLDNSHKMKKYAGSLPTHTEIKVMASDQEGKDRLIGKLAAIGINFVQQGVLDAPISVDGTVGIEITVEIDHLLYRSIAKIGFNYVAHQHGASFALQSDFDDVRNYIRYGTIPSWDPVVQSSNARILANDDLGSPVTNKHLITFHRATTTGSLVVQVSPFNTITYRVMLCPRYSGLWDDELIRGHHFDFDSKKITPLRNSNSSNL